MKLIGVGAKDGFMTRQGPNYDDQNPNVLDVTSPNYDGKRRRILDADGNEIEKVVRCDMATGECIQIVIEPNALSIHINDDFKESILYQRCAYKTPLRAEILEPVEA